MKFLAHSSTRLVTGTVGSGKKSIQYIPASVNVGIACVTTLQTQKYLSRSIPPIGMTTVRAFLTGILGRHRSEMNTVHFTALFKPPQPVAISPGTDRTPDISTQPASEFSFIVQIFKSFYGNTIHVLEMTENFFHDLVHSLFKSPTGLFLAVRSVRASLDSLNDGFDVQAELGSCIDRGQGIDSCIYANGLRPSSFRSSFDFETELDIRLGNDVRVESFALSG